MIPYQFNIAFNMNDVDGRYKFRMPVAPAYLQKHYQQKCLWNLTRVVLPKASTMHVDQMILVRLGVPSSQTFIQGSVGTYTEFNSQSPAHVQFFTLPIKTGDRVEWSNFSDEIQTAQIGGSAWGNDLEVSVFVVTNAGVITLASTQDEVIQLQFECVSYDDQYDYERFKTH
jgi:hypothetical protein